MNVTNVKLKDGWIITDDGFIVHLIRGEVYKVNQIGLEILRELQEGKSKDEICKMLAKKYSVEIERVTSDFDNFIEHLKELDIAEV